MKKFKSVVMTIIIVISSFTLSGCEGKEPNEIAYIVALGIDKGENDNFDITIQYANTTQISGGSSEEGGKSGSQIVENITVEAPNIYSAMSLANHVLSKTFSLSHAKLIVFSQEVAKAGLKDIVETFIRSEELRPDVYLAVALDNANKYLESVNPVMDVNPAKYYQMVYDKNTLIGIPDGVAKNFFFSVKTEDYDCLLPVAGVISSGSEGGNSEGGNSEGGNSEGGNSEGGNSEGGNSEGGNSEGGNSEGGNSEGGNSEGGNSEGGNSEGGNSEEGKNKKQQEAPINNKKFEYKMKNYIGGQAAIEQKNKSEAMGSAVFEDDKMVGMLGSIETEMFKLLIGDYKYSYLTLYNEKTPESPVTVKAIKERRPKYRLDKDEKKIYIELFIEGDIYSLPADYNIEDNIENFEKNSKKYIENAGKEFMTQFMEEYDSDIFRLKEKAKGEFLTNEEYEEYKKTVNFREYDINIDVNFQIRRTGLVVREK